MIVCPVCLALMQQERYRALLMAVPNAAFLKAQEAHEKHRKAVRSTAPALENGLENEEEERS